MKLPVMKAPFLADRAGRKLAERRAEKERIRQAMASRRYINVIDETSWANFIAYIFMWLLIGGFFFYLFSLSGAFVVNNKLDKSSITSTYQEVLKRNPTEREIREWRATNDIDPESLKARLQQKGSMGKP